MTTTPLDASPERSRKGAVALAATGAIIPTTLAATGMIAVATSVLQLPLALAVGLAVFLELAVVTEGALARRRAMRGLPGGVDAAAMWVFSALSGVLAAAKEFVEDGGMTTVHVDSRSVLAAAMRFLAPLVACWLWERCLSLYRQEHASRTVGEAIRDRRNLAVARAALAVRRAAESNANEQTMARARRRLDRAHVRALRASPPADNLPGVLSAVAAVEHLPAATVLAPAAIDRETGARPARRPATPRTTPAPPLAEGAPPTTPRPNREPSRSMGGRAVTLSDEERAAVEAALVADPTASIRALAATTGITRGRLGPYLAHRQQLHAVA